MQKVDTIIVSDIHLGFNLSRIGKLTDVLEGYEFERLILNGDIFDGLNFARLHTEHWDFLSYLRKLTKNVEVIWIAGNHDGHSLNLSRLIGINVYEKYEWRSNGKKYLAIHGHQFDIFLHKNVITSNVAVLSYYTVQKILGNSMILGNLVKQKSKKWRRMSKEVARGALLYAKLHKADVVFCGHTHIAMEQKKDGIIYYNSGSWVERPSAFITIYNDVVQVVKID